MTLHIIDDKELNARMNKVFFKTLELCEKENFTAKDVLWLCFLLKLEVQEHVLDLQGGNYA